MQRLWLIVFLLAACSQRNMASTPRDMSTCSACFDGAVDLALVQDLARGPNDQGRPDMARACRSTSAACGNNALCPGVDGGCCAAGEWCKDGNTCLCGDLNARCTGMTVCSASPEINGCGMSCCQRPGCP
jgi:hypothetical protein